MPKKLIQDIVVRKAPTRGSSPTAPATPSFVPPKPDLSRDLPPPSRPLRIGSPGGSGFWGKKKLVGLVGVLAVGIFLFVSSSFATATVSVTPRQIPITLASEKFLAVREEGTSNVHFEIMKLEADASKSVPSTGTQKVQKKAQGSIVVYNTFDTKPQQLVAGTRFEAPNGKIYKADSAVTVPGKRIEGGKEVAGSVVVAVTAAEAGESYNLGLSDFSIPGFKGSARYEKFYGRSKTEMTGGYIGEAKVARDTDILDAYHKLEDELKKTLVDRAVKEVPPGYLFYEGADFFRMTPPGSNTSSATSSDVTVTRKATLYAMIIDRASLAAALAGRKADDAGLTNLDIANPEGLTFQAVDPHSFDPATVTSFSFKLTGAVALEGKLDDTKLAGELAGVSSSQFPEILQNYPMIERAEADFSPGWSRSFPKDAARIRIQKPASGQ